MIANGKANEIVFVAIDLPTSLTVKSVATTTNGKLKAAQVNLISKISIGIDTRKLDIVIITMCSKTRNFNNFLFFIYFPPIFPRKNIPVIMKFCINCFTIIFNF